MNTLVCSLKVLQIPVARDDSEDTVYFTQTSTLVYFNLCLLESARTCRHLVKSSGAAAAEHVSVLHVAQPTNTAS